MNRKEFEKKYKTEIALMAREKDVDMGVHTECLLLMQKKELQQKRIILNTILEQETLIYRIG